MYLSLNHYAHYNTNARAPMPAKLNMKVKPTDILDAAPANGVSGALPFPLEADPDAPVGAAA